MDGAGCCRGRKKNEGKSGNGIPELRCRRNAMGLGRGESSRVRLSHESPTWEACCCLLFSRFLLSFCFSVARADYVTWEGFQWDKEADGTF